LPTWRAARIGIGTAGRRLGGVARKSRPSGGFIFYVNYLGGNMPTFALNYFRPGGQIISQYYLFLRLSSHP
jgi:hypothetical protein